MCGAIRDVVGAAVRSSAFWNKSRKVGVNFCEQRAWASATHSIASLSRWNLSPAAAYSTTYTIILAMSRRACSKPASGLLLQNLVKALHRDVYCGSHKCSSHTAKGRLGSVGLAKKATSGTGRPLANARAASSKSNCACSAGCMTACQGTKTARRTNCRIVRVASTTIVRSCVDSQVPLATALCKVANVAATSCCAFLGRCASLFSSVS